MTEPTYPISARCRAAAHERIDEGLRVLLCWWPVFEEGQPVRCACGSSVCSSIGKHPIGALFPHGVLDATNDHERVDNAFDRYPEANLAISTQGLVALDFDPERGGLDDLAKLEEEIGPLQTRRHLTGDHPQGRGLHAIYTSRHEAYASGKLPGFPGIDVKAEGGYVMVPDSRHPSGVYYERVGDVGFAEVPEALKQRLLSRSGTSLVPRPVSLSDLLAHAPEGPNSGRHDWSKDVLSRLASMYPEDRSRFEDESRSAYALLDPRGFSFEDEFTSIMEWCWAKQQQKLEAVASLHLTDLGNAERLVALYGDDLRYSHQLNKWYVFDNRRWRGDDFGEVVRRVISTIRTIESEAQRVPDGDVRKALLGFVTRSEAAPRIHAMVDLARHDVSVVVRPEDFDTDPMLFCVENGVVELAAGKFREHRREDMISRFAPVTYDASAQSPLWLAFINQVCEGDQELIAFLKRAIGYTLTGMTTERVLFLLVGGGANGKSVFVNIVSDLLGEYGRRARPETFMQHRPSSIPNDIAALAGARFLSAVETEEEGRLGEALLKELTGGDQVTARYMFHEFFTFEPKFKLWFVTNHKPEIRGTDDAIWDRIRLIPFRVRIPEHQRDPDLRHKLREELPGILNWAIEGCLQWQAIGLRDATAIDEASADYRQEQDLLGQFLDERCRTGEEYTAASGLLHSEYNAWLVAHAYRAIASNTFADKMAQKSYTKIRRREGVIWLGIGLRPPKKAGQPTRQGTLPQ